MYTALYIFALTICNIVYYSCKFVQLCTLYMSTEDKQLIVIK